MLVINSVLVFIARHPTSSQRYFKVPITPVVLALCSRSHILTILLRLQEDSNALPSADNLHAYGAKHSHSVLQHMAVG